MRSTVARARKRAAWATAAWATACLALAAVAARAQGVPPPPGAEALLGPDGEPRGMAAVLARYNDNLLFHASFDAGRPAAEAAAGQGQATKVEGEARFAPGVSGQALAAGTIVWAGAGNVRFDRPGTVLLWVNLHPAEPPQAEGYQFLARLYARGEGVGGLLMLGKMPRTNGANLYLHLEATRHKHAQIHAYGPRDWRADAWHLVAFTWRRGGMSLSLDGKTPQFTEAPPLPEEPTQMMFAAGENPATGYRLWLDEIIVLDLPLDEADLAWVHTTVLAAAPPPAPAAPPAAPAAP